MSAEMIQRRRLSDAASFASDASTLIEEEKSGDHLAPLGPVPSIFDLDKVAQNDLKLSVPTDFFGNIPGAKPRSAQTTQSKAHELASPKKLALKPQAPLLKSFHSTAAMEDGLGPTDQIQAVDDSVRTFSPKEQFILGCGLAGVVAGSLGAASVVVALSTGTSMSLGEYMGRCLSYAFGGPTIGVVAGKILAGKRYKQIDTEGQVKQ